MWISQFLENFHFLRPLWLLLLMPVLGAVFLNWRKQQAQSRWQRTIPEHLLKPLLVEHRNWKRGLPLKAAVVLGLLYALVLAGPTWQRQVSPLTEDRSPVIIVLDLAKSMLQNDVTPNRLERAKYKIRDFLAARGDAQTALIAYSGSAHTVLPLTTDRQVFLPMLAALEPGLMPVGGKDAGLTIPLIKEIMATTELPATVILMTDGLGFTDPAQIQQYFSQTAHQLLVLGIGSEQVLNNSIAPIQQEALKRLAERSAGGYLTITLEDKDIEWLQKRIKQHLITSADNSAPWQDLGYYLVFPLMLVALFWFRKGWTIQWGFALTLLFSSPQPAMAEEWRFIDLWLNPDQQAEIAYRQGKYLEAAQLYQDPMRKGKAFYMAKQFKLAQGYFRQVAGPQARFNEANALAHQLEFVEAITLYRSIQQRHPDYPNVAENIATLETLIELLADVGGEGIGPDDNPIVDRSGASAGGEIELLTYTAEDLTMDPKLAEKWMREVQPSPAKFLRYKFKIQHALRELEGQGLAPDELESP